MAIGDPLDVGAFSAAFPTQSANQAVRLGRMGQTRGGRGLPAPATGPNPGVPLGSSTGSSQPTVTGRQDANGVGTGARPSADPSSQPMDSNQTYMNILQNPPVRAGGAKGAFGTALEILGGVANTPALSNLGTRLGWKASQPGGVSNPLYYPQTLERARLAAQFQDQQNQQQWMRDYRNMNAQNIEDARQERLFNQGQLIANARSAEQDRQTQRAAAEQDRQKQLYATTLPAPAIGPPAQLPQAPGGSPIPQTLDPTATSGAPPTSAGPSGQTMQVRGDVPAEMGSSVPVTSPYTGQPEKRIIPTPAGKAVAESQAKTAATQQERSQLADQLNLQGDVRTRFLATGQMAQPKTPAETAQQNKEAQQQIIGKLNSSGELPADYATNVNSLNKAVQRSKTLTQAEKDSFAGYSAVNTSPPVQGTTVELRGESFGQARMLPVLDTQNGNRPQYLDVTDLNRANIEQPGRYIPQAGGQRALSQTALLEDIRGNIDQVRQSLKSMPELSAVDKAKIAVALRESRDPRGAVSSLLTSGSISSMSPQMQDYLINLAQLHENALAMRSTLGAGQGSQDLRAAIAATIPGPTMPNNAYGLKQLDAAEKTVNRLSRGVPSVPLRPMGGTGGGAPAPAATPPGQPRAAAAPAPAPGAPSAGTQSVVQGLLNKYKNPAPQPAQAAQ